jgi:threonine/homoserine/homoserine lactone efflux protein
MEIAFCLKGIAAGFVLCAPLGPVGLVCLQRTMAFGRREGFFSILGAAVIDGFYGIVAGFGMSAIGIALDEGKFWFQLFGGVALVGVGIRLYTAPAAPRAAPSHVRCSLDAFLSTFTLMLSNPLPIVVISAALSATTGGRIGIGFIDILLFALGLFTGSLLWSPILVTASSLICSMLQPQHLSLINRACGAVIVACGLALGAASLAPPSIQCP